jgi:hypothetical protein
LIPKASQAFSKTESRSLFSSPKRTDPEHPLDTLTSLLVSKCLIHIDREGLVDKDVCSLALLFDGKECPGQQNVMDFIGYHWYDQDPEYP